MSTTSLSRNRAASRIAMCAAILLFGLVSMAPANAAEPTIKVGWVKALSWTPWAATTEAVQGVKVELIPFGSSNDELVALASGSIDMAPVGYNNVAALLAAGEVKARFVAGITANGSVFVARKGSGIKNWSDLKGKTIGSVRGSTQYVNLATALAQHGLDINNPSQVKFRSIQSFNALNLALQRGDIDAMVTFPPLSEQAIQAGYGHRVAAIQKTLYDGSFYIASGILASDRIIRHDPAAVQAILNSYVAQMNRYSRNYTAWIDKFKSLTGMTVNPALFRQAFEQREIVAYPDLNASQVQRVATILYQLKVIPVDTSARLLKHLDYTFLEKATGKSARQLGAD